MKVKELIGQLEIYPEDMEVTIFSEVVKEFISDFDIYRITVKQAHSCFLPIELWNDHLKDTEVIELNP